MGGRHVYIINDRQRTIDALTLAFIVALSAAPYIARLGFYSDDWSLLASFKAAAVSGRSVIATTLPNYGVRPVQGVYLALLYEAFGFRPLGYHLVNMAVITASDVLLYLLLLRLHLNRSQAFAAALIFVLMPQLTTVRVWFAAFQIPLSILFALIAMHAQMTFDQTRKGYWLLIAVSSAALSIGAYE